MNNNGTANGRIAALMERQKQIEAALAIEKQKVARKQQRDAERLFRLAGETLLRAAPEDIDFELTVKEKLRAAPGLSDADRAFLARMGWQ